MWRTRWHISEIVLLQNGRVVTYLVFELALCDMEGFFLIMMDVQRRSIREAHGLSNSHIKIEKNSEFVD